MDSGAATTFGRPILLPGLEAMDVKYVLNIADEVRLLLLLFAPRPSRMYESNLAAAGHRS